MTLYDRVSPLARAGERAKVAFYDAESRLAAKKALFVYCCIVYTSLPSAAFYGELSSCGGGGGEAGFMT